MDCSELGVAIATLARGVADTFPSYSSAALDRGHEVLEALTGLADRNPEVGHLRATALTVEGVVLQHPEPLVEAERILSGTLHRFDHARAAALAAHAVHTDERRVYAETALHEYAEAGADHDVARARAEFRRLGIAVRTQPRTRPTFGWEALTRTEARIAAFVATGATNPEIAQGLSVSRRTVETHVSNVLAKLGLRSRTELAVFVARRLEDA
jgi:DNA-binding CsgD family transcriptional regulator